MLVFNHRCILAHAHQLYAHTDIAAKVLVLVCEHMLELCELCGSFRAGLTTVKELLCEGPVDLRHVFVNMKLPACHTQLYSFTA